MTIRNRYLTSTLGGLATGSIITILTPGGSYLTGLLACSLLMGASLFFLLTAWKWAGGGKLLAVIVFTAFFLRLAFGIGASLGLMAYGYQDNPMNRAGYLYLDAYRRDDSAWTLATSGETFFNAIQQGLKNDQYGGLLLLSAAVYRILSPDLHRPFLILILAAFTASLGVLFFWKGVRARWNSSLANLAAWILVFYPDAVLLNGAQLREPFLIGLTCIAFWGMLTFQENRRRSLIAFVASLAVMSMISALVGLAVFVVLIVWFWLENSREFDPRWRRLGWIGLGLAAVAGVILFWQWFMEAYQWDLVTSMRISGWVKKIIEEAGEQWRFPIIVIYGVTQVVLPAAIAEPAIPIWRGIAIWRAVGWYALVPFLIYGAAAAWKTPRGRERRVLMWLAGIVLAWIVISSARAGGDQWDNPRYRTIFIPWMALLAAWAWQWVRQHRDPWLPRLLLVETIFLGFFTNWYVSRYYQITHRMPFWRTVAWIVGLGALVFGIGWLWDHRYRVSAAVKRKR